MRFPLFALLACTTADGAEAPRSQAPAGFWDHWGDGRAELASYALTQPRYGELRTGRAVLVFVTEDLDRATRVKTDADRPKFPVLKLIETREFTTGLYDYEVLTSAFVPLDGSAALGVPAKVSLSVQEWCGHVYEQWVVDPGTARVDRHSYFDGEGDAREVVEVPTGAVFGDAWPVVARGLAGERVPAGGAIEVPWLPPLLQARLAHVPATFTTAKLTKSAAPAAVEVPAGRFDAWTLTVEEAGGRTSTWWVEAAAPHRLLRWEASDGERAELTHVIREPYWRMNREADTPSRSRLGL